MGRSEQYALGGIAELIAARPHDVEHIQQVAYIKRFLELYLAKDEFFAAYQEKPQATLNAYQLPLNADEMQHLFKAEFYLLGEMNLPVALKRYRAYLIERRNLRLKMQAESCRTKNKFFEAWRSRQINRCKGEFGSRNRAFIHHPIAFELTVGRTITDSFRFNPDAKPLEGVLSASGENIALWQSILHIMYNLFGKTLNRCFFATDPMDNLEYKSFNDIYQKIYQYIPPISTSMALKDITRTKAFLKNAAMMPTMHQFLVHNSADFDKIMKEFSPSELLYVELVLDFPKARQLKDIISFGDIPKTEYVKKDSLLLQSVISCSGFVINMVDRTIRLTTPCNVDSQHPQGEIVLAKESFVDATDVEMKLRRLIKRYMPLEFDRSKLVSFQPYCRYSKQKSGFCLESMAKYKWTFIDDIELNQPVYRLVGELIEEAMYTSREIATLLMDRGITPEATFACIQSLYHAGVIREFE